MSFTLQVYATSAVARFDEMGPDARRLLEAAVRPRAEALAADARARVLAHVHTIGAKPGLYLSSIYGGVSVKDDSVVGYVRTVSPLAHLLEWEGANLPAHDILPKTADVLAFDGDSGKVFRKAAHFPGAHMPPYPAIDPAFEAARSDIESELQAIIEELG